MVVKTISLGAILIFVQVERWLLLYGNMMENVPTLDLPTLKVERFKAFHDLTVDLT